MTRRRTSILLGLLMLTAPALGCLGPRAVEHTRARYNEVILKSNNEELLLNLVRLRHDESLGFLPVSALTAQFEMTANLLGRGGIDRGGASNYGEGQLGFSDRPTISFTPQRSPELTKALFSHIPLDTFYLFAGTGHDVEVLLRLFVRNVNGIENIQSRQGSTRDDVPDDATFRAAAELTQHLHRQRKIVLATENHREDLTDLAKLESVSAPDLIRIKEAGLGLRSLGEKNGYVLTKTTPMRMLRIASTERHSPELLELERLIGVKPGQEAYEIEDVPEGQLRNIVPASERTKITLTTRSVLEVMYLLSRGIRMPEPCNDGSKCTGFKPGDGASTNGLEDLFQVWVTYDSKRPSCAAVAVQYHDAWYYIKDDDTRTRANLVLFNELFRLQRIGVPEGPPVLTLPVGR